jgi:mRNA-degrading endonuclease RelE of RelBE toxin-antitoxin system
MKTRVEVFPQVLEFVAGLPPAPRHAIRLAIRGLQHWRGDIRPLRGKLEGYYRLRVSRWRILFRVQTSGETQVIQCVFAEARALVYEVFSQVMATEGPP